MVTLQLSLMRKKSKDQAKTKQILFPWGATC